jgi:hypothetical protein
MAQRRRGLKQNDRNNTEKKMNGKLLATGLLSLGLSVMTAGAWNVSGVVSCPNGNSCSSITVSIQGVGSTTTTANGAYLIELPDTDGTYTICVDPSSLPAGTSVSGCTTFSVDSNDEFANVDFTLSGDICTPPPGNGPCWLTGGGTVFKTKGQPQFSYGGVVNPGCSPIAAGGGNWNVVDHAQGLHFKGQNITVVNCSGVPTKSPKVTVNVIDFTGTGILVGVAGNPAASRPVCFTAEAIDNSEPGAGKDALYLRVYDCNTGETLMLISNDNANPLDVAPATISTGNLQIHQSSCK